MANKKGKVKIKRRRFKISPEQKAHHEIKKKEIVDRINAVLNESEHEEPKEDSISSEQPVVTEVGQEVANTPIITEGQHTQQTEKASPEAVSEPETADVPSNTTLNQSVSTGQAVPVQEPEVPQSVPVVPADSQTPEADKPSVAAPEVTEAAPAQPAGDSQVSSTDTQTVHTEPLQAQSAQVKPAGASSIPPPWRSDATGDQISGAGSSRRKLLWIILIPILIGVILIDGYIIYTKLLSKNTPNKNKAPLTSVSSQQKATPTPSPTPVPVDLSKYNVQVLNGSGIRGLAAQVKSSLEDAGFTVSSVGNAEVSTYTETVIQAKKSVPEGFTKQLTDSLSKTYKVASKIEELDASETSDVVVVIGSNTAQ